MSRCVSRRPLLALVLAGPAPAQGLPAVAPAAVGVAPDRLARLDAAFREAVAERKIAGAVVYVARGGRTVDFEAFGFLDAEKRIPMPKDAIFRIASMSKAVTTVAALMLLEEGRITLGRAGLAVHPVVREDDGVRPAAEGRSRRRDGARSSPRRGRSRSATS